MRFSRAARLGVGHRQSGGRAARRNEFERARVALTPLEELERELRRLSVDRETAQRLLDGVLAADDIIRAYTDAAALVRAFAAVRSQSRRARAAAWGAATAYVVRARTADGVRRIAVARLRPKAALAFAAVLAATTGAAFAGELPAAAQRVAAHVLALFEAPLPGGDEAAELAVSQPSGRDGAPAGARERGGAGLASGGLPRLRDAGGGGDEAGASDEASGDISEAAASGADVVAAGGDSGTAPSDASSERSGGDGAAATRPGGTPPGRGGAPGRSKPPKGPPAAPGPPKGPPAAPAPSPTPPGQPEVPEGPPTDPGPPEDPGPPSAPPGPPGTPGEAPGEPETPGSQGSPPVDPGPPADPGPAEPNPDPQPPLDEPAQPEPPAPPAEPAPPTDGGGPSAPGPPGAPSTEPPSGPPHERPPGAGQRGNA